MVLLHLSDVMLGGVGLGALFGTAAGAGAGCPSGVDESTSPLPPQQPCPTPFAFIEPVYGWVLRVPDLTPDVGVFWQVTRLHAAHVGTLRCGGRTRAWRCDRVS